MAKKNIKKISHRKTFAFTLLLRFFPLFLLIGIITGGFFWYQSRAVPDLGDESEMTMLPPDFQHVLGVSATPNEKGQQIRVPIFMYHYVEANPTDGREKFNIPPSVLQSQIETLKGAGYTFINAQELTNGITGRRKLPVKSIMLTFDDGYMDLYTDVFPILKKENVKAVAYIITGYLNRPNYLFTYQLEELAKSPLIEIGSHTLDHPGLAGMNKEKATEEIVESRKFLQDLLHIPVNSFAYPYGSFDQQAIDIVKDTWYSNAVSVIPGDMQSIDNKYFLNRLRPGYRSGQVLLDFLKQDTFQPW